MECSYYAVLKRPIWKAWCIKHYFGGLRSASVAGTGANLMADEAPAIAIDVGVKNSRVAVCYKGSVEIVPDAYGNRVTPSYIAFTATGELIGDAAQEQQLQNLQNTISACDFMPLMGRKFSDPVVQEGMKHWPFKVIQDKGEKPAIQVEHRRATRNVSADELYAMLLGHLRDKAQAFLDRQNCRTPIRRVAVTVPAVFDERQRAALFLSCARAGVERKLQVVPQSVAAGIGYGMGTTAAHNDAKPEALRNILIFSFSAASAEASVLQIGSSSFEVKATCGDTCFGGEAFDSRLMAHFVQDLKCKHGCKSPVLTGPHALLRLRAACETVKRELSSVSETKLYLEGLPTGTHLDADLSRKEFEELCSGLFPRCQELAEKVLVDAQLDKSAIHDVVLVGGSSRIPKVQQVLQSFFVGKELRRPLNPEEAAVCGAAKWATRWPGAPGEEGPKVLLNPHLPQITEHLRDLVEKVAVRQREFIKCVEDLRLTTLVEHLKKQNSTEPQANVGRKQTELVGWMERHILAHLQAIEEKMRELQSPASTGFGAENGGAGAAGERANNATSGIAAARKGAQASGRAAAGRKKTVAAAAAGGAPAPSVAGRTEGDAGAAGANSGQASDGRKKADEAQDGGGDAAGRNAVGPSDRIPTAGDYKAVLTRGRADTSCKRPTEADRGRGAAAIAGVCRSDGANLDGKAVRAGGRAQQPAGQPAIGSSGAAALATAGRADEDVTAYAGKPAPPPSIASGGRNEVVVTVAGGAGAGAADDGMAASVDGRASSKRKRGANPMAGSDAADPSDAHCDGDTGAAGGDDKTKCAGGRTRGSRKKAEVDVAGVSNTAAAGDTALGGEEATLKASPAKHKGGRSMPTRASSRRTGKADVAAVSGGDAAPRADAGRGGTVTAAPVGRTKRQRK